MKSKKKKKESMHNEELRDLYSSPSIIGMIKPCSTNWGKEKFVWLLVGEPEGKTPLGIPRRRWVDNIKLDLGEIGWGGVDWIGLA
jgi:hypothetical protein